MWFEQSPEYTPMREKCIEGEHQVEEEAEGLAEQHHAQYE
jgi:hypothetical protein